MIEHENLRKVLQVSLKEDSYTWHLLRQKS